MTLAEGTFSREQFGITAPRQYTGRSNQSQQGWANIGANERAVSVASGAILGALGLMRGGSLGAVIAAVGGDMLFRGASGYSPLYHALGLNTREQEVGSQALARRGIRVQQAFLIAKPADQLYAFWRDFTRLPQIMTHLERVDILEGGKSHWVANVRAVPGTVEWDAQITRDEPDRAIAWTSLPGAAVHNAGEVRFEQAIGDRGTIVRAMLSYVPPAGALGAVAAKLYSPALERQIREDIRNFKRLMETGEIPTVSGQTRGTCTGQGKYEA
ncbi:MAG TPA: SRPBCC family protein [Tepidisphaeraceae bacterium]|jgi:uncharacterized membrane protein